jgi:hypothetical protein
VINIYIEREREREREREVASQGFTYSFEKVRREALLHGNRGYMV